MAEVGMWVATCQYCGKRFHVPGAYWAARRHYCSHSCASKARIEASELMLGESDKYVADVRRVRREAMARRKKFLAERDAAYEAAGEVRVTRREVGDEIVECRGQVPNGGNYNAQAAWKPVLGDVFEGFQK